MSHALITVLRIVLEFLDDLETTVQMIFDWYRGKYMELPAYCVIVAAVAVIFSVWPLSCIPFIGMFINLVVIYICLKLIAPEIRKYRKWREC